MHILLLEDDEKIAREIVEQLEKVGYSVMHAKTVSQAQMVDLSKFSLLVLDWNLPDGQGVEVAAAARSQGLGTPILMLTANTEPEYRKTAVEQGANDFLGKPFYFHELKARIDILINSEPTVPSKAGNIVETSGIILVKNEMKASYDGQDLTLTRKEFELLLFFISNPNIVFSRNEILDAVWGEDENPSSRTVDTHVLHLRKKMSADLFQTVWSSGYRFVPRGDK